MHPRHRTGTALAALLMLGASLLLPPRVLSQETASLTDRYREVAGRLIGAALTDEAGWSKLTHLTTSIGHRLSGSDALEEAIRWADRTMRAEGLDVTLQPVMVPHWVRGEERARVVGPVERRLAILGLGGSVGTPPEGIEAPVVVVGSFDELEALDRTEVEGRIVLFAVEWEGYGRTVRYRSGGASAAARKGAVAALVRSATGNSLYTPHTGAMRYDADAPRIPAAAVTVEDAEWMRRMAEAGETVTAHDDGAACMAAWQALTLIKQLGLRPRRTLRVVLWTNEENGLRGGNAYREWVGDAVSGHVAAIEMDGGNERPVGFGLTIPGGDETAQASAMARAAQIGRLLEGLEAGEILPGGGGADVGPLMRSGVPGLALRTAGEHYFDWHHTDADTLDKIRKVDFRKAVAMLAVMGYTLADMPGRLAGPPSP